MVKFMIAFLLLWQHSPGFHNQALKRVLPIVYPAQINISGPLSRAIKKDTVEAHLNAVYTPAQQAFPNSKFEAADYEAGLFTIAFCKIIR